MYFCYYLPLEKDIALHLNKPELLHQRMLRAKIGSNWPIGSREEGGNVKVKRRTDEQSDNRQQVIRKVH